jgi:signal transduction histidine kinase
MNPLPYRQQPLAAKLMLAFILVAVPPMLLASHAATRLANNAANAAIGRWLRETSRYMFNAIKETQQEIAAIHTMLYPRFARSPVLFTPEELDALFGLEVDCFVLQDAAGTVLASSPDVQSLAGPPLYPGGPFYWATMNNGEKELAIALRRTITAEDGGERQLALASLFRIRLSESGDDPFELRIFVPDGDGFRQEYASSPSNIHTLPREAVLAMNAGAGEYAIFDADWTDDIPDKYFLFTPVRDNSGEILAVFAVSARMFAHENGIPGYYPLFSSFFFGGTLLSGCVSYVLARRLTRSIRLLSRAAGDIAAGNFASRVAVRGKDEIAELADAFNLMAGQLELMQRENVSSARRERSRMLGEIALGFAHEIRNPLLVIKTSAELAHGKLPDSSRESRLLGFVVEEVGRIDALISEFLSFAKPAPLRLEYFQLDSLIRDVLELSAAEFTARRVTASFADETPDGRGARVLGEENKIRQVLLNLLLNAMDAMPEGGVIAIRLFEPENKPLVCLEVTDTGMGIPADLLPTIHLPFISTKKNGLGLGLAKAYAIIEEHGGSIVCESSPGRGTVFTIRLNA